MTLRKTRPGPPPRPKSAPVSYRGVEYDREADGVLETHSWTRRPERLVEE